MNLGRFRPKDDQPLGEAQLRPEDDGPLAQVRAQKMYYVYFAKSLKNNKIYVGSTGKDPKIRIKEHNAGSNQWSNNNKPLKLVYYESYVCKEDATKKESFYKTGIGKRIKYAIVKEMDS